MNETPNKHNYLQKKSLRHKTVFVVITVLSLILFNGPDLKADFNPVERAPARLGAAANGSALSAAISTEDEGASVVFASAASNYVTPDNNDTSDVFLFDRDNQVVTRVSVSTSNTEGNGASLNPAISADGSLVVFESHASNLVANDTNDAADIFLRDVANGTTTRISLTSTGQQSNGNSFSPAISDDGAFVAYVSQATNLIARDTNEMSDIYVYEIATGSVSRVSISSNGIQSNGSSSSPTINDNGDFVAFASRATNLIATDTNESSDVFLYDRTNNTISRVSVSSLTTQGNDHSHNPSLSDDGTVVAFDSLSSNLAGVDSNDTLDVFVHDTATSQTTRVSINSSQIPGNGASQRPTLSGDARFVGFESAATNLTSADTNGLLDVFVHDRTAGTTVRISVKSTGAQVSGSTLAASINGNANFTAFISDANNFASGNATEEVEVLVINNQCLLTPPGVTTLDSDSDGTDDCADICPLDANKIAVGTCGCGIADVDTDSDGTLDCNDGCPSDANKTAAGVCGCGVSDDDTTGSGLADCLDPTTATVPRKPRIKLIRKRGSTTVVIRVPRGFKGVSYKLNIRQGKAIVRTRTQSSRTFRLSFTGSGRFLVRYRISVPGQAGSFTKSSRRKSFRIN